MTYYFSNNPCPPYLQSELKQKERGYFLAYDEILITPSVEYDNCSGRVVSDVTLPDHKDTATWLCLHAPLNHHKMERSSLSLHKKVT